MNTQRTPEEIEQLKTNWLADPCWDIEDEEGFEAHREELLAFHKEQSAKWEAKKQERDNARIEKVMLATGVGKVYRGELLSLRTFEEIDYDALCIERTTDDPNVAMQATLVRATLLQAAQLKRIADALESMSDSDSLSNSVKIWGAGS